MFSGNLNQKYSLVIWSDHLVTIESGQYKSSLKWFQGKDVCR